MKRAIVAIAEGEVESTAFAPEASVSDLLEWAGGRRFLLAFGGELPPAPLVEKVEEPMTLEEFAKRHAWMTVHTLRKQWQNRGSHGLEGCFLQPAGRGGTVLICEQTYLRRARDLAQSAPKAVPPPAEKSKSRREKRRPRKKMKGEVFDLAAVARGGCR